MISPVDRPALGNCTSTFFFSTLSCGAWEEAASRAGLDPALSGIRSSVVRALPALAWWLGRALGLGGVYYQSAVLFAALPTATSAYILAVRMGGDGPGVAWLVTVSTMTAMLTLPVWLTLL